MKILREYLLKKINILSSIPQSKNPILSFLKWDNDYLMFTNSDVTIKTDIKADEEFRVLIPCLPFKNILNKMNCVDVDLKIENNNLIVKGGRSRYKLILGSFKDYPNISIDSYENSVKIDSKELKAIIDKVAISCATSNNKPILAGVHFNHDMCEATDSFRYTKLKLENDLGVDFILPRSSLLLLNKIMGDAKEVNINYEENNVIFEFDDVKVKSSLLCGKYPNTTRLITIPRYYVEINRNDLLEAIDRISIFAGTQELNEQTFRIIGLNFTKNNLELISSNNGIGKATDECECENTDFLDKIHCNLLHLSDALKTFNENEIKLCIYDANRPFYIQDSKMDLIQLILPIRYEDD